MVASIASPELESGFERFVHTCLFVHCACLGVGFGKRFEEVACAPQAREIAASHFLRHLAEVHAIDVHDGEVVCAVVVALPQNVARRVVAVEHIGIVDVCGEARESLRQWQVDLLWVVCHLIEAVGVGALHAYEIRLAQYAHCASLDVSHRFRRLDASAQE